MLLDKLKDSPIQSPSKHALGEGDDHAFARRTQCCCRARLTTCTLTRRSSFAPKTGTCIAIDLNRAAMSIAAQYKITSSPKCGAARWLVASALLLHISGISKCFRSQPRDTLHHALRVMSLCRRTHVTTCGETSSARRARRQSTQGSHCMLSQSHPQGASGPGNVLATTKLVNVSFPLPTPT
jgi:hypothetical protein